MKISVMKVTLKFLKIWFRTNAEAQETSFNTCVSKMIVSGENVTDVTFLI